MGVITIKELLCKFPDLLESRLIFHGPYILLVVQNGQATLVILEMVHRYFIEQILECLVLRLESLKIVEL